MQAINKQSVLTQTHYGVHIYAHILRTYYPDCAFKISERDCGIHRNPFNQDKPTLHIFIQKENSLGNALDNECAYHTCSDESILAGNVFDFAQLHYKQSGNELLQTINQELYLHIAEERNFHRNNPYKEATGAERIAEKESHRSSLTPHISTSFSFFKAPINNIIPYKAITLHDAHKYIVGDYAKEATEKLRNFADPKHARMYKAANFSYCTFSGRFSARSDKQLIQHSQLMCVDFDHLPDVQAMFNRLLADEYFDTQLLFRSPSGDGLKWIIPIDTQQATHQEYFAAVSNYLTQTYLVPPDKSGRDISRACFLPHDPQAYINPQLNKAKQLNA